MEYNNQDGSYAIQEQGDLGLGTIAIDKKYVNEKGDISIPKDNSDDTFKRISVEKR